MVFIDFTGKAQNVDKQFEGLKRLIDKYYQYKKSNQSIKMSEETTRMWINDFLGIFGWDVQNTNQVLQEQTVGQEQKDRLELIDSSHTKPDYTLVNGRNIKTYLDAKKTSIDIFKNKEAAFQIKSYGWSAGVPCAFLSNFEQFIIYDCQDMPSKDTDACVGALQLRIDEYLDNFLMLQSHLDRDLVCQNQLINLYSDEKIEGVRTVDYQFNALLSEFRLVLANEIYKCNGKKIQDGSMLNFYVQMIIDRIIFIRVCESRGIEKTGLLKEYVAKGFWKSFKNGCYVQFHEHYDGALFSIDSLFHELELGDTIFEAFVEKLYYPYPYQFNAIPIKVIAKVYEEFLSYSLVIDHGTIRTKLKEDYVKTNGAVPTNEFIADAICSETLDLNKILSKEDLFRIKILDPCCGSGVFLISAYEQLANKLSGLLEDDEEWCIMQDGNKFLTVKARQQIMKSCLYGIDCDPTAVEVTKMSLALKIVDDTNAQVLAEIGIFGEKILNDIHKNIVCGNTLIDADIQCENNEIKYIKPLNIRRGVYKGVYEQFNGFDYIIGNPPYVETKYFKAASGTVHQYLKEKYDSFEGKADLSVLFVERCLSLLNPNGIMGVIIQRRWFKTSYGTKARKMISAGKHLAKLYDISTTDLFRGKITYVSIMILSKYPNDEVRYHLVPGGKLDVQKYFENEHMTSILSSLRFDQNVWAPEFDNLVTIKDKYLKKWGSVGENKSIHIKDGIQALWKKVYDITDYEGDGKYIIGKNGFGERYRLEKEMLKPVIYNRIFSPLKKLSADAYRIFPYKGELFKEKISIEEVECKYPETYQYLMKNKVRIMNYVKCNPGEYWHTYTREHNHDLFNSKKIIIPMTAKDTIATYVSDQGFYMDNSNVWFINLEGNNEAVMKALTMVINSVVFSVMAKSGANPQMGGYYKFNKQFLTPVPLPNEKLIETNSDIKELEALYNGISELQKMYDQAALREKLYYEGLLISKWERVDEVCNRLYELENSDWEEIKKTGRTTNRIRVQGREKE